MNATIKPDFSKRTLVYTSENGARKEMNFIIANIFDAETKEHLMTALMNEEAWQKTKEEVWFYSTSRDELWHKGETSGNRLVVVSKIIDCDGDAVDIFVKVLGDGNVCHTGRRTCFFNSIDC